MLLWKRYGNNKMAAMRIMSLILHLQQYSHRLNLLYFFFIGPKSGGEFPVALGECYESRIRHKVRM